MRIFLLTVLFCASLRAQSWSKVVVIAHRGEHLHHPENTMPAFAEAIRVGADFIEVDVRTSADGKLVLSHDSTVDRCTNGRGKVAEMTLAQLQALDAGGAYIPTFDEVLDLARGKIGIYVDLKSASAQDLVSRIEAHGMADRVVIYCGLKLAKEIQALRPGMKVMPEAGSAEHARLLVDELHPRVLAFDAKDFRPEAIAVAKAAGVDAYVDRLGPDDTPEAWHAAIAAGANGIQTDHPAELVAFLKKAAAARPDK
jgi:glycerophosphoryl diester phosphodiesterase